MDLRVRKSYSKIGSDHDVKNIKFCYNENQRTAAEHQHQDSDRNQRTAAEYQHRDSDRNLKDKTVPPSFRYTVHVQHVNNTNDTDLAQRMAFPPLCCTTIHPEKKLGGKLRVYLLFSNH